MLPIPVLNIVASFIAAFFITWLAIPRIVAVSRQRRITDKPGNRKIHTNEIPTLGGIGIFSGFFVSLMLFVNGHIDHITILAAGSMIIFLMGTKDDLENMDPPKKLFVEFLVALLISCATDIRITTLHGFLGIGFIPTWISILITIFLIILIMNSFNLIDGIDGLAASIGILISLVFGTWFWMAGAIGYTVLAMSITGALSAFLPFNVYKGRFKIFMGDTGSLTIGLLMAILAIKFNELNAIETTAFRFQSAPAVSIGILFLPLFDTLRVTIIRITQGQHPFRGDNNHLHHRLLRLGLNHRKSTLIMVALNSLIIIMVIALDKKINTILQLRLHPVLIDLKKKIDSSSSNMIHDIDLTYITSRGNWYFNSWKGDIHKSGGIATNIGIHFFDMLTWIFGDVKNSTVNLLTFDKAAGYLELEKARVRWFLSLDYNDLPQTVKDSGKRTYRSILMDKNAIEFSEGFTDLHSKSYEEIFSGQGFGLKDAKPSVEIVYHIRNATPVGLKGEYHELCKKALKE